MTQKTQTPLRKRAMERLNKRKQYLERVGIELQKGTVLDQRSWTWMT